MRSWDIAQEWGRRTDKQGFHNKSLQTLLTQTNG